jgi:hypothetical protein
MLFLIEYSRSQGKLVTINQYPVEQRADAENRRLELELNLNRKSTNHEVVLLEAPSQEALLKTHSRYFRSVREILDSLEVS